MATRYVDAVGGLDSNSGASTADPWKTIQKAKDTAVAGDTVFGQGIETLTVIVDVDTNAGSIAAGYIQFIGVNSSWVNDGTMWVINGNSAVANCFRATAINYIRWENIEVKGSTSHGLRDNSATPSHWIFDNCWFHNCGGHGVGNSAVGGNAVTLCVFNKCRFYLNTLSGAATRSCTFNGCIFYSQVSGVLFVSTGGMTVQDCVMYLHTTSAITTAADTTLRPSVNIKANTLNNNGTAIIVNETTNPCFILENRITNNATAGISLAAGKIAFENWNAYGGNGIDKSVNAAARLVSGPNSQTGITIGYNNAGAGDFNLVIGATLRRTSESLDGTNNLYHTAGLHGNDLGGGSIVAPGAPVISEIEIRTPTLARIRWTWVGGTNAGPDYYVLERSNTGGGAGFAQVGGNISAAASLEYDDPLALAVVRYYRIKAVNSAGSSAYSAEKSVTMPTNTDEIPTRAEADMKTLIQGMTIAGGYHYNWGMINKQDLAKAGITYPTGYFELPVKEDNLDETEGAHSQAYFNEITYEFVAIGKVAPIQANSVYIINEVLNNMVGDFKKLFGVKFHLTQTVGVLSARYAGFQRMDENVSDIKKPVRVKIFIAVKYVQNRILPTEVG